MSEYDKNRPYVRSLHRKQGPGLPMQNMEMLELLCDEVNVNPRQVTLARAGNLEELQIEPTGARVDIVLDGGPPDFLGSGDELLSGSLRVRITFACEPCSHGASLASAPMRKFRRMQRFCGIVLAPGTVGPSGSPVRTVFGTHPPVPESFAQRCAWAARQIPAGRVVPSVPFLKAVGASAAYARVLPRWLAAADLAGAPVHRILTSRFTSPSWCEKAVHRLGDEGLRPSDLRAAQFDLSRHLWLP
ncbi:hypothetical protein [Streptomyces sp. NPDC002054]|uniref:hypothetical protein n=1 Tax=Streptomyces sp. NPDC002054 TaxID=3154663 RepID=UPI003326B224